MFWNGQELPLMQKDLSEYHLIPGCAYCGITPTLYKFIQFLLLQNEKIITSPQSYKLSRLQQPNHSVQLFSLHNPWHFLDYLLFFYLSCDFYLFYQKFSANLWFLPLSYYRI